MDSLTSQDLPPEGGERQAGGNVPKSTARKEPAADHNSGTPIVPQTASKIPPKPSLTLAQPAHIAAPDDTEVLEETSEPRTSPDDQTDPQGPVTASSQASSPASATPYPSLPYSSAAPVRGAVPGKAREALAAAAMKAQAAAALGETQRGVEPDVPQQPAPSTSGTNDTPPSVSKSTPVKFVSMPAEPAQPGALDIQAAPSEAALAPAASLPIRASAVAVQPPASSVTGVPRAAVPMPQRVAIAGTDQTSIEDPVSAYLAAPPRAGVVTAARANVKTLVAGNSNATKSSLPLSSSSAVSNSAPLSQTTLVSPATPVSQPSDAAASTMLPSPSQPAPPPQSDTPSAPSVSVTPQKPERAPATGSATNATYFAIASPAASTVSSTESGPETTLAAPAVAAPTSSPAPLPAAHEALDRSFETAGGSSELQRGASSAIPAPKVPLVPQAENFAFAVRMLGLESSPIHLSPTQSETPVTTASTPATQPTVTQPKAAVTQLESTDSRTAPEQSQTSSDQPQDAQPSAPNTDKPGTSAPNLFDLLGTQHTSAATPHWNDVGVWQAPESGSMPGTPEPAEAAHANLPLAAQEAHLLAPEMPKTSTSSEILLHLTDNDQSAAAIRVADRAGSVNVSVHASDPVLRESLRSNLGDLSNQLSNQGWKADVIKSAVAAQSGSQQDSHAGEHGSQPQQSFGGDRQPQRDRRANGGRWQQELDQQISGGDAHSGGNG